MTSFQLIAPVMMMDLTTPNAKSAANPNNTTQQHTTKDDLLSNVTQ